MCVNCGSKNAISSMKENPPAPSLIWVIGHRG